MNFSGMQIDDEMLLLIGDNLINNGFLKRLYLNENIFGDYGFTEFIKGLEDNAILNVLSFIRCHNLTNESMKNLREIVHSKNMSLY